MVSTNTENLTLSQASEKLTARIPVGTPGRAIVLEVFGNWLCEWNSQRSEDNQVFARRRESTNIGYVLDRDDNRSKVRTRNFVVVKVPGNDDYEFKSRLHIDFSFQDGYPPLSQYLKQRSDPKAKSRWVVTQDRIDALGADGLRELLLNAYRQKGGSDR